MRIIRNAEYINARKRRSRWMAILGFVMLTGTFFVALSPNLLLPAYAFLLFGFILFNQGMQQLGKWNRPVRNDQIIDKKLDKLGDQYTAIHYAKFGNRVVDHMLIHPGGVLVITAKEYFGDVFVQGRRWKRRGFGLRRIFGLSGPQLGNPSWETDVAIETVEKRLGAEQFEAEIGGAVLFTDPRIDIEAEGPDYPILLPDELPTYLKELEGDDALRPADRQRLAEILSGGGQAENVPATTRRRPVKRRAA